MRKEADDTGPMAELEHWRMRMAKFNSLVEQINAFDCRAVLRILHIAKSKTLKVTFFVAKGLYSVLVHLHVPALGEVLLTYGCFCLGGLIHHTPF